MKRLTQNLTYANIVATLALFFAMGGAAYAAVVITSANVKDGSLTSIDFKLDGLGKPDLTPEARSWFVGLKGNKGPVGYTGARGLTGPKGPTGPGGESAPLTSTWASRDMGLVTDWSDTFASPNNPSQDWDAPTYGSGYSGNYLNLRTPGNYRQVNLDTSYASVLALGGMPAAATGETVDSYGLLTMPWAGKMTATASLSFLHRNDGEDLDSNGASNAGDALHVRVQCRLAYGTGNDTSTFTQMGAAAYASSNTTHQLVNVTLVGNVNTSQAQLAQGAYNVAVLCRDVDATGAAGSTQWSLAGGNLTVVGSAS